MADVTIKRNDTRPVLSVTLVEGAASTPIDLTPATAVKMYIRKAADTGSLFLTLTGVVTDAVNGVVDFTFGTGNLSTVETYLFEVEVTFGAGAIETIPNNGYKTLQVVADLGP